MKIISDLKQVQKILNYEFKNKKLLQTALIHSSYSNEHRGVESNERLEFLGDAVIEFIITEILYLKFSGKEGDLSKIRALVVSEKPLSDAVERLGLDKFLVKGVGESKNKVKSKAINCDLFEAICGAIFLDGGIEKTKEFFNLAVGDVILSLQIHGYEDDPKTKLQELLKRESISYKTAKTGEEHMPTYETAVFVNSVKMGVGVGSNKKQAEENAAADALNNLKLV